MSKQESSGRVYAVIVDKAAQKALERLPSKVIARIAKKIDSLGN